MGEIIETRPVVPWEQMNSFMIDAFKGYGVPEEDAKAVSPEEDEEDMSDESEEDEDEEPGADFEDDEDDDEDDE